MPTEIFIHPIQPNKTHLSEAFLTLYMRDGKVFKIMILQNQCNKTYLIRKYFCRQRQGQGQILKKTQHVLYFPNMILRGMSAENQQNQKNQQNQQKVRKSSISATYISDVDLFLQHFLKHRNQTSKRSPRRKVS